MSDNDMIRRGDALAAVQGFGYGWHAEEVIAALPPAKQDDLASGKAVTVRVKPLVWRDEFMRWSGNSFTSTAVGAGHTYIIAASLDDPEADNVIAAKKAGAQADYEARIRAALEPVAAPDPVALLRDVPRYEPDNPLDNAPSMKADPQGDWLREADVLAALSRALIQKGAAK